MDRDGKHRRTMKKIMQGWEKKDKAAAERSDRKAKSKGDKK